MSKKQKTEREIDNELRTIYAEKGGEMPDLTKMERVGGTRLTRFLIRAVAVLFILSATAWGGFFVWNQGWFQNPDTLETAIEGPREARAGEEVHYTVRYHNTGRVPVAALETKLNLPLNFHVISASPSPTEGTTWNIGSLTPGSDGAIVITGVFRSEVPSTQTIQAFFAYRPANFSSDFQDIETVSVSINDSAVDIAVTGPEKALAGDELTYVVNLQNAASSPVENILVTISMPADFSLSSAEPAPTSPDNAQWTIARIMPGELVAITLNGTYTSSASGEQAFTARAAFLDNNVTLAQAVGETKTEVLGGNVAFHLIVNGSSTNQALDLGQAMRISIDYANNSNETVEGLAFTLVFEPAAGKSLPINWTSVELDGVNRVSNTLTWNASNTPAFARFGPNTSGIIDLTVPLLASLDSTAVADRFTLKLTATMAKIGSIASPRSIETTPVAIALNSNLAAFIEARYFSQDAEAIGTGPLPPSVGETTTYRLIWKMTNTLHPLTGVTMTTNLPPDVAWTTRNTTGIGTIRFDEVTRLVTWTIDRLPVDVTEAVASFDVAITPDANDVGAFFKLTNATAVEAMDATTNDRLSRSLDILTTELPTDTSAVGKGVVVE